MIWGKVFLIPIFALFSGGQFEIWQEPQREEMPLEKYSFRRDSYDETALRYLMGNAEMGGLVNLDGLGFGKLWLTDLWMDSIRRKPVNGPQLINNHYGEQDISRTRYRQDLNIKDGLLTTTVQFEDGGGYETEIFFSRANKHLLIIRIQDFTPQAGKWKITMPTNDFELKDINRCLVGNNVNGFSKYTQAIGALQGKLKKSKNSDYKLELSETGEAIILISIATHFDGIDYQEIALKAVSDQSSYEKLKKQSSENAAKDWAQMGSVILPEGDYAKWFYRSLYFMMVTAGADHFLPGEMQFSIPTFWDMHGFTYGHAGWSTLAFASMGHQEKAFNMAKWHYQPEALKENINRVFPERGKVKLTYQKKDKGEQTYLAFLSKDAIAFGHELTAFGFNVMYEGDAHWDWQRQLDGFAATMFHTLGQLYPDSNFENNYTYPVMKGTAELWRSLFIWDEQRQIYYLPPLLSVSENIMEKSVLDAVLSARWNLLTAADYAEKNQVDSDLSIMWRQIAENALIPQNKKNYLEYLDDTEEREGGGYFGIRAAAYLGYPCVEQISSLDRTMVRKTLDKTWQRNNEGEGMISFIMNWFALTEAMYGYGEKAYSISNLCTTLIDDSDATMGEALVIDGSGKPTLEQPYFLTGYSSFALVPIHMMLQSHQNEIRVFPAMTRQWKNAAFYDLPAIGGLRVSGEWKEGRPSWIIFKKDGITIKHFHEDNFDFKNMSFDYQKLIKQ